MTLWEISFAIFSAQPFTRSVLGIDLQSPKLYTRSPRGCYQSLQGDFRSPQSDWRSPQGNQRSPQVTANSTYYCFYISIINLIWKLNIVKAPSLKDMNKYKRRKNQTSFRESQQFIIEFVLIQQYKLFVHLDAFNKLLYFQTKTYDLV